MSNNQQHTRKQLMWGFLIIGMGVLFLMDGQDILDIHQVWRHWPELVTGMMMLFGISSMIPPTSGKNVLDGLWNICFALWFYASWSHLYGLTFRNSWPILVIISGAGMVLQPLVIKYADSKKEM